MVGAQVDLAETRGAGDLETGLAVEAAVGEVVDDSAEGRLIKGLARIEADCEDVAGPLVEGVGEVEGGRGPSAFVDADEDGVAEDLGAVGGTVEDEAHAAVERADGHVEDADVAGEELVVARVEAVEGEFGDGVREADGLEAEGAGSSAPRRASSHSGEKYQSSLRGRSLIRRSSARDLRRAGPSSRRGIASSRPSRSGP